MQFANPGYLFLLILLIPAIAWYIWKQSEAQASLQVSSTSAFQKLPRSWKEYLRHVNFALLCGAAAMTIVALARPQSSDSWSQSNTEGWRLPRRWLRALWLVDPTITSVLYSLEVNPTPCAQ